MKFQSAKIKTFSIRLPHVRSEYEVLKRIGDYVKVTEGVYEWTFPIEKVEEVQVALGGKVIAFDKEHLLKDVIAHCDPLVKELELNMNGKGKGELTISVDDEAYELKWFQKGEEVRIVVAKALVEEIWFYALGGLARGDQIKSPKLAEKIVRALEKHHWDIPIFRTEEESRRVREIIEGGKWNYEKSKNFNWKYFFGDRGNYFRLFYAPIKCLVALKMIYHSKGGVITKLVDTDEFDSQRKFVEVKMYQDEEERQNVEDLPPSDKSNILKWAMAMR